ncbi:hypothetical protein BH24ACT26_BH24ACT26_20460 [soil metagenome]
MGDDEISFYFGSDQEQPLASDQSTIRMEDAGLPIGEIEARSVNDGALVRVRIETTLGDRTQMLERTIPVPVIDALGRRRVLIDAGADIAVKGREVETSPLGTTYVLGGGAAIYRFSGTFVALSLAGSLSLILRVERVTKDAGSIRDPVWSPDGTRIAFIVSTELEQASGRSEQIVMVDVTGGDMQPVGETYPWLNGIDWR